MTFSVSSLVWAEGSDYVYGTNGSTVSTTAYLYSEGQCTTVGDWFEDRGLL